MECNVWGGGCEGDLLISARSSSTFSVCKIVFTFHLLSHCLIKIIWLKNMSTKERVVYTSEITFSLAPFSCE